MPVKSKLCCPKGKASLQGKLGHWLSKDDTFSLDIF
jgi:hypothetical protein